jgi:hypothetical protein
VVPTQRRQGGDFGVGCYGVFARWGVAWCGHLSNSLP